MTRSPGRLTAAIYRYRTEGDTPVRQALAIGLGLFIGCTPFIGFHSLISIGFGWLFGLNRFKAYVASNISNPLFAPFLYALELQVGAWLRTGQFLSPNMLAEARLRGLIADLLVGSVVVGSILALAGFLLTYWGSSRRAYPDEGALVDAAAERYLLSGITAWELARYWMRTDPVYIQVLKDGRLPQRGVLLHLRCGQGLMLALIVAACERWRQDFWPTSWPRPPLDLRLQGIDARRRVVRRARTALDGAATINERDFSQSPIPACDAIVLIDALQLLSRATQDHLLAAAAAALPRGGVFIIREADADAGWRFRAARFRNRFAAIMRGELSRRVCFDGGSGWSARLTQAGFAIDAVTRQDQGMFGNVLIQARKV